MKPFRSCSDSDILQSLLMLFLVVAAHAKEKRPNLILLLTDDQDVALGGMDEMPQLKRLLMEHGTTFENAFVHTPICCPSRSSILTGKYLHNIRVVNNSMSGNCNGQDWRDTSEKRTFAVHARHAGYQTAYAGKYLNQYGDEHAQNVPPGWDKWFGLVGNSCYYHYQVVLSNDGGNTTQILNYGGTYETDYLPDVLINRTLDSLDQFTITSQPFLLVAAWPTPHGPFTPAPQDEHAFDGARAFRTPNWNASLESISRKHWFVSQLAAIYAETEAFIDNMYQLRLESLLSVDRHIQQIVDKLQERGILDDTIIIYTSDNGFQLGQHRLEGDKRQLYEHDIRVPFVVRGPGFAANSTSSRIVMNIDIAPTIVDMVSGGAQHVDNDMDGISFAPCSGEQSCLETRRDFLVSYHGEGSPPCGFFGGCPPPKVMHGGDCWNNTFHCVRTLDQEENTVYCGFQDDVEFVEFYDMNHDEWQLDNLYPRKMNECQKRQYKKRLEYLRQCEGPTCREGAMKTVLQAKLCS
jgi:N-acetylglucosamine-6-sulfatase